MSEITRQSYPDKYEAFRNISSVAHTCEMYHKKFGVLPKRKDKENSFDVGNGVFKTIGGLFKDLYGTKTEEERQMDTAQFESKVSKAKVGRKTGKSGSNTKQMVRDAIKAGTPVADVEKTLTEKYISEGRTPDWSAKRAKHVYQSILKESK